MRETLCKKEYLSDGSAKRPNIAPVCPREAPLFCYVEPSSKLQVACFGGEKRREKRRKGHWFDPACINATKTMQRIPTILIKWRLYDLIKHNQHPNKRLSFYVS
jgi:hypothetical protein